MHDLDIMGVALAPDKADADRSFHAMLVPTPPVAVSGSTVFLETVHPQSVGRVESGGASSCGDTVIAEGVVRPCLEPLWFLPTGTTE